MSEKELRKVAGHKGTCRHSQTHYMSTPEPCTCGLDEALAADPDVVAVLRWLKDGAKRIPGNTPVDRAWTSAARALEVHIERTFHIRLTADGYEWTDSLTAAEAFAPEIEQSGDAE